MEKFIHHDCDPRWCKDCDKLIDITEAGDNGREYVCKCTGRRFVYRESWDEVTESNPSD